MALAVHAPAPYEHGPRVLTDLLWHRTGTFNTHPAGVGVGADSAPSPAGSSRKLKKMADTQAKVFRILFESI